jgi:hypothetical protein
LGIIGIIGGIIGIIGNNWGIIGVRVKLIFLVPTR